MTFSGIATGPATPRPVERKNPRHNEKPVVDVYEVRVLEDSLGDAIDVQVWDPPDNVIEQLLALKRGQRIAAGVKSLSMYGSRVRLSPDLNTLIIE